MSRLKQTAHWLWGIVRNPDVVWVDRATGEETHERWSRLSRFQVFRPMWIRDLFTIRQPCGCRKRFGLWRTIWCSEHAKAWLPKEEENE